LRYAILGGSFDPVHKGHLGMAQAALSLGYDRIIFVPAYQSPFKSSKQGESAETRLLMLLAAISGNRRWTVDACEIKREGVSYTIDTINDLASRYESSGKFGLILGDDLAPQFSTWKDAALIAEKTDIIVASRLSEAQTVYDFPCVFLGNALMEHSSASVRDLIQSGGGWLPLVPGGAVGVIREKGLYGVRKGEAEGAGKSIEDEVRGMVSVSRFIHSRNVALHSADLAARFGLDAGAAYLAGIAHDMCKEFNKDEMIGLAKKDGAPINELETQKPSLLHGRAAAILIKEKFGIADPDIIEAIRYHTMVKSGMGPLAQIVYLTDKIEVARTTVDPRLRRLAFGTDGASLSLDALFGIVLDATVEWLLARGLTVFDETLRMYQGNKIEQE
jgi:nicotinate-nucleotide adenylyltransferase